MLTDEPSDREWLAAQTAMRNGTYEKYLVHRTRGRLPNGQLSGVWLALHPKKRATMGHISLGSPFIGCEAHHVDKEHVVYIPKTLHRSVRHNIWTGQGMEQINALAYQWLAREATIEIS